MSRTGPITAAELMAPERYAKARRDERRRLIEVKRRRRMDVGPSVTLYFENRETILYQIHEMLHIEKGGAEQVADELAAYNPLVPDGRELVATLMVEIDDPVRRQRVLAGLGGVEEAVALDVGGRRIPAAAERDVDRTAADGKTSSVHFLHFAFDGEAVAAFRAQGARVVLEITHPGYRHMAVMPEEVRAALSGDFA